MMGKLLEQLKQHEGTAKEGKRHVPYRCSEGKLTIGFGRNLDANGIRDSEAELMLRNDIAEASEQLMQALPFTRTMDHVRRDVLINMVFNMGKHEEGRKKGKLKILDFKGTLAYIKSGDYENASIEMLDSVWARQVGYRAKDLSEQMRTGEYK